MILIGSGLEACHSEEPRSGDEESLPPHVSLRQEERCFAIAQHDTITR